MALDPLRDATLREIRDLLPADQPLASLEDGHWSRDLELDEDLESDLSDLAAVQLEGGISAAVHLTRRAVPPARLDTFEPDPDSEHAIASLVLAAEAGARLEVGSEIGTGVDVAVGPRAAARFTLAQHRRYPTTTTTLEALKDLLRSLRNPYDPDALATLADHELFSVELTGTGTLAATAGWEWGLVRSLDTGAIGDLVPGDLAGVRAGAKAGVTVHLGLEGRLRVLVDRSPRDPERRVRVRLYRRRGQLVGAGLTVSGGVRLAQAEGFVDSIVSRLLQVPDDFVDRVSELGTELRSARELASGLDETTRGAVADATETDGANLDRLLASRAQLEELSGEGNAGARLLQGALDSLAERLDELGEDLVRYVDEDLRSEGATLSNLESRVGNWLAAYRQARKRAVGLIVGRARQGIEGELAAGINRRRAREALVELDFELSSASGLLIEAIKGHFGPAIERARTPGATGVELIGGTLKQILQRDRFYNLRLNLLGFVTRVDFQRFNEIEIATDLVTGTLTITGQSGARLSGEQRRRLDELSFLFDVYGAIERRDDELFTAPGTQFRATLARSGQIAREERIEATLPRHLDGLRRLNAIDSERAAELRQILLTEATGPYSWDLVLGFPPSAIPRMLSLDVDAGDSRLRDQLWDWMRQAVEILDLPVPHPHGVVPLSSFFEASAIRAVEHRPVASGWTRIADVRGPDRLRFQDGAYRRVWAYLLNARTFINAYLESRSSLLAGQRLRQVLSTLENLSAKTTKGSGSFATRPFDAKYLVFALAEGLKEVELGLTLKRGDVAIRL